MSDPDESLSWVEGAGAINVSCEGLTDTADCPTCGGRNQFRFMESYAGPVTCPVGCSHLRVREFRDGANWYGFAPDETVVPQPAAPEPEPVSLPVNEDRLVPTEADIGTWWWGCWLSTEEEELVYGTEQPFLVKRSEGSIRAEYDELVGLLNGEAFAYAVTDPCWVWYGPVDSRAKVAALREQLASVTAERDMANQALAEVQRNEVQERR